MKWITRSRPKADRIGLPLAHPHLHRPGRRDPLRPGRRRAEYRRSHRPAPDGAGEWCTFETLIAEHDLGGDPALARLAKIVHAADIAADLHSDPLGPGLLAIGLAGLDVKADDQVLLERGMFVYDALFAWCTRQVAAPV